MKWFHNKGIGKFVAVVLGTGIALYFAWNFYYFGYWVGEKFLGTVLEGQYISGYGSAAIMFLAVLFAFFYKEYMKEDIEAYEAERGDGSYIKAFENIVKLCFALEFFSVAFRWYILNWAVVGFILLGVGVILMWFEHLLGKALHAQANSPAVAQAARVMDEAGSRLWDNAPKYLPKMSADQLRRVADGDPTPLDEVLDIQTERRSEQDIRAAEAREKQNRRWEKARGMASTFLAPKSPGSDQDFE